MKIKVISLNLWWGGNLFPAILEFLKAENADIVMLQEVYNGTELGLEDRYHSMRVLHDNLDYPYSDYAQAFVHDSPVGMIPQGNAILSKFPITAKEIHFLAESTREAYKDEREIWPILPRILQHVALNTPAGEVNVFNMHGVWDLAGDSYSPARRKMGKIIIEATGGKQSVILGGDSNATTGNQLMKELDKHLKNVFGTGLKSTFNMRRKKDPGYATASVDALYVSPSIEVIEAECPDIDISDHLPLISTLQIP